MTEANGETTEADGDVWIVEYLLQAIDDPSLVVPAARVWHEKGRVLEFLGRRFENPQERLLADLGRASRLFPAIEDTLKTARPEACYLTTAEAYSFPREVAPLLEESGFGVLVPPWWHENRGKAARLGVHLKVRAPASASTSPGAGAPGNSYFGMDSLVEYDWQIALGDQVMDKDEFRRLVALKVPLVRVRGEWVEIRPEDVEAVIKFWDRRRKAGVLTVGEALATALQAGFRVAITGTPIENRLSELWSIMDFLNPGYLGPAAEFRRKFAIPIERYRDRDRAERLRRLVGPFILRRLKTDPRVIQDLPEKEEVKVYCTLTKEQATLYEAVVSDMLQTIEGASGIERRGVPGPWRTSRDFDERSFALMLADYYKTVSREALGLAYEGGGNGTGTGNGNNGENGSVSASGDADEPARGV